MDPVTLEVTITEALRRPLSQLDAASLLDLLALAESEEAPRSLKRDLAAFRERMEREIGDLPDGHVWNDWVAEIATLDASRVPESTRAFLSSVVRAEGRAESSREALEPLEEQWAEVPATPFEIAGKSRRVEKHEVMNTSEPLTNRRGIGIASNKPKRKRRAAGGGGGKSGGTGGAPNRRAAPPNNPIDTEKLAFLVQLCSERLSRYGNKGLAESILMVGVRKKAEDEYPGTTGRDVQAALKHLEDTGKAKKSAGRWIFKQRWSASS